MVYKVSYIINCNLSDPTIPFNTYANENYIKYIERSIDEFTKTEKY